MGDGRQHGLTPHPRLPAPTIRRDELVAGLQVPAEGNDVFVAAACACLRAALALDAGPLLLPNLEHVQGVSRKNSKAQRKVCAIQ